MVALERPLPTPIVDVLALVDGDAARLFADGLAGLDVRAEVSPDAFVRALTECRARITVVGSPPAPPSLIEHAAEVRRRRPALRCVLLNERAEVGERLRALELGFDAALARDIPDAELIGRLRLLARDRLLSRDRVTLGDGLELDVARRVMVRDGRAVHLRPKEFHLLELLTRHPGRVYTRAELLERVWGSGPNRNQRTVDVHVRWLRSKIERDPDDPAHLVTVRGVGYRLDLEAL
jgi:DNA-binding response OmpR family regulator